MSQKYGKTGNQIPREENTRSAKANPYRNLIFIDIPYVSVSWQPPKYDIPLVSVRIALLQFAKALRFLHDSLHLDGFAFVNVSQKHNLKRKKLSKPRKALYVSKKYGNPGNLIWRGRRIHGLLKPIHIGRLIFINIPYVSLSW